LDRWGPGTGYVTVLGNARLVEDPEEKASRWKDEWAGFNDDRDANHLLIEVTLERVEVIDYTRGIEGNPGT